MESCGREVYEGTTQKRIGIFRPRPQVHERRGRPEIIDITDRIDRTRARRVKPTANTDPRNTETETLRIMETGGQEVPGHDPTVQRAAPRVIRENRTTLP